MKNKPYKHEGRTVWYYNYLWTDDKQYNEGNKECHGCTIATQKIFKEMHKEYQELWGFHCWAIKKRHTTKEEYDDFIKWQ